MSSPPDDFSELTKLLSCKRYEQPPPGYFNGFSEKVISRIESEELVEYSTWWQWLVEKFDAKPVVACIYGLTVSGLLLAGFRLSEVFEKETASAPLPVLPWLATSPGSGSVFSTEFGGYVEPSSLAPSVQPVFRSERAHMLFSGQHSPAQPINFSSGISR